jgi:hypothetical protein
MAVLHGIVLDYDTCSLEMWGFKISEQAMLVTGRRWDTIVANEGLCENQNLTAVGRVGHGLRISNQGGSEHSFARDVGLRTKRLARKDWSILKVAVSDV